MGVSVYVCVFVCVLVRYSVSRGAMIGTAPHSMCSREQSDKCIEMIPRTPLLIKVTSDQIQTHLQAPGHFLEQQGSSMTVQLCTQLGQCVHLKREGLCGNRSM